MEVLILAVIVIAALAVLLLVVGQQAALRREVQQGLANSALATQQRLDGLDHSVNERLSGIQASVATSMARTTDAMTRVGEQLGGLGKTAEQVLGLAADISKLQDILKPPKMRGGFGELLLEQLLQEVVPGAYSTQYHFRNGTAVDAVVHLGQGLVPIDSKFPLESFNRLVEGQEEEKPRLRREFERAVRGHVDAITAYIRPEEGTLDFALMYVPAEHVWYEIILGAMDEGGSLDIMGYAQERRVFPVSPRSLYPYLCAIALGLKGMRIEEQAREIIERLGQLDQEFAQFRSGFDTLGSHIAHAKTRYEELDRAVGRIEGRLHQPLRQSEDAPLATAGLEEAGGQPAVLSS